MKGQLTMLSITYIYLNIMSLDCAMAIQKSMEHSMINHCDGRITQLGDIDHRLKFSFTSNKPQAIWRWFLLARQIQVRTQAWRKLLCSPWQIQRLKFEWCSGFNTNGSPVCPSNLTEDYLKSFVMKSFGLPEN